MVDTALREAREELGVTVATDRVWGVLKPLRDTVRTTLNWIIYSFYPYYKYFFCFIFIFTANINVFILKQLMNFPKLSVMI